MSMMKIKRRKKATRFRGTHTHGRGFKKKARGKGHRGGVGMAGTGKKAGQKKSLVINEYGNDYFGKEIPLAGRNPNKIPALDLRKVLDRLDSFIRNGKAKKNQEGYEIDLSEYKILSTGNVKAKIVIKAKAASQSAIEKVRKAGGEIILADKGKKAN